VDDEPASPVDLPLIDDEVGTRKKIAEPVEVVCALPVLYRCYNCMGKVQVLEAKVQVSTLASRRVDRVRLLRVLFLRHCLVFSRAHLCLRRGYKPFHLALALAVAHPARGIL
jgi:hypothetical protein